MKRSEKHKKLVLILHGFPGLSVQNPIRKYFDPEKYKVVIPQLFEEKIKFERGPIIDFIELSLNGKSPDVIVGISLGGLLAQILATKYNNTRLVLIGTGARVDVAIPAYNFLVKRTDTKIFETIIRFTKIVPPGFFSKLYKIFNPPGNSSLKKEKFDERINETLFLYKGISILKLKEIRLFVQNTDNSNLISEIKNETIIFSGGRDIMMPQYLSKELNSKILRSQLIINSNRLHFDIFNETDFDRLDKFLYG